MDCGCVEIVEFRERHDCRRQAVHLRAISGTHPPVELFQEEESQHWELFVKKRYFNVIRLFVSQ